MRGTAGESLGVPPARHPSNHVPPVCRPRAVGGRAARIGRDGRHERRSGPRSRPRRRKKNPKTMAVGGPVLGRPDAARSSRIGFKQEVSMLGHDHLKRPPVALFPRALPSKPAASRIACRSGPPAGPMNPHAAPPIWGWRGGERSPSSNTIPNNLVEFLPLGDDACRHLAMGMAAPPAPGDDHAFRPRSTPRPRKLPICSAAVHPCPGPLAQAESRVSPGSVRPSALPGPGGGPESGRQPQRFGPR